MPDALAGWSEDDAGGAEEVAAAVAAVAPLPLHRAATRRSSSSSRLLFVISDAVFRVVICILVRSSTSMGAIAWNRARGSARERERLSQGSIDRSIASGDLSSFFSNASLCTPPTETLTLVRSRRGFSVPTGASDRRVLKRTSSLCRCFLRAFFLPPREDCRRREKV